MTALYIALGGALGSVARYGLATWVHERVGQGAPWGTLVVNVAGSFLIGLLMGWFDGAELEAALRAGLVVGVLGGFTTFSALSYETLSLLQEGAAVKAVLYAGGSVLLGLIAVYAGFASAGAAS